MTFRCFYILREYGVRNNMVSKGHKIFDLTSGNEIKENGEK